jgi:hypothetical protein
MVANRRDRVGGVARPLASTLHRRSPFADLASYPTAVDTPFPQHGKNYMDREPKLPTPMIDPEKVARAILNAAIEPTMEAKVGATAKLNALVAKLSPTLAKKLEAKQAGRQQYDEPPRDPEGTLDKPGEAGQVSGQTRGTGGVRNGARPNAR